MVDTEPHAESRDATAGLPNERPPTASEVESPEDEGYRPPDRHVAPLDGKGPLPFVKRFNRKTVGIFLGAITLVVILAFATALNRGALYRAANQSAAETTTAAPAAADTINGLPGSYGDAPRLGPPVPGEVGSMMPGTVASPTAAGDMGPTTPSGATSASRPGAPGDTEEVKLAARAREGRFGFSGTGGSSGVGAAIGSGLERFTGGGSPAMPLNSGLQKGDRDADNRQDDKQEFLERDRPARWELKDRLHKPTSPYTLFAGTVIPGVLITGINSDLPGQIEGQISQNVYDTVRGEHLILPQGTKLLGSYDSRIVYGQVRVLVVWTRIIRPDGSNIDLEGMPGVDLSGYAGLTGNVDRHLGRLLTAVLLGSVIQAGTNAGTSYTDPTFAGLARQGAGQGVNEATQQIVRKELQLQPTIEVPPGARFTVFTTRDISIPAYTG
jgi:type IV secretion system protein VirB10